MRTQGPEHSMEAMMGAMQRRKGAAWEREVANRFKPVYASAKRGLGQCRDAGEVGDVDIPHFWPECKAHQKTNPRAALAQAVEASGNTGKIPIAVCKDNGGVPFVVLSLDDFIALITLAEKARGLP